MTDAVCPACMHAVSAICLWEKVLVYNISAGQFRKWPSTESQFELWAICATGADHSSSNAGKFASEAGDGRRDSQFD